MHVRHLIPIAMVVTLSSAGPALAASEVTGTLTAGSGTGLSGTVGTSSGGSLSGTVGTSSGGSLSGTVSAPSGGLSGTVTNPPSGGGGGGGGAPAAPPGTSGGGGAPAAPGGDVLGEATSTPFLPSTGAGGSAEGVLLALALSGLIAALGAAYLRKFRLN